MFSLRNGKFLYSPRFLCKNVRNVTGFGAGDATDHQTVPVAEARRFAEACMTAVAVKESHAKLLSDLLVTADSRGHYSHGMNRLGKVL